MLILKKHRSKTSVTHFDDWRHFMENITLDRAPMIALIASKLSTIKPSTILDA